MLPALIYSALRHSPVLLREEEPLQAFDRSGLSLTPPHAELSVNQKLGHLYEDALAHLLESSPRYDLLEKGLQIQSDRHHTLGELDYLLRDTLEGKLIHLELAVKFYLAIESADAGLLLPGPDARDNYYKKRKHLLTRQLTLTQRHHTSLPLHYQREAITPQSLVLGCLFNHISAQSRVCPEGASPSHRHGVWLKQCEFLQHFPHETPYVIPKPLWPVPLTELLLPLSPLPLEEPLTRCVMVKVKGREESSSFPLPVFITPNNYPGMECC